MKYSLAPLGSGQCLGLRGHCQANRDASGSLGDKMQGLYSNGRFAKCGINLQWDAERTGLKYNMKISAPLLLGFASGSSYYHSVQWAATTVATTCKGRCSFGGSWSGGTIHLKAKTVVDNTIRDTNYDWASSVLSGAGLYAGVADTGA